MGVNERKAKSIALVPIGQVDESILAVIGEGLREAFGRDYVIATSLPHPDYAYNRRRGQYRSDDILARLRRLKLPAEKWLGVVDVDLYTPGLNFVFGQATMGGPAASSPLPACVRASTACQKTRPYTTSGRSRRRYTRWATPTGWAIAVTSVV